MRNHGWQTGGALVVLLLLACGTLSADTRIERELALDSGGKFILDTDTGSVEVVGGAGSGVRVILSSSKDDFESMYDVHFEERPGEVEVRVDRKRKVSSWFRSGPGVRFRIEVPSGAEIDIDTAGGEIEAREIGAAARLDTSGGEIRASRIGGPLLADTSGGAITIEEVDGDVDADTSGGGIRIDSVRGNVRADTSGGSIAITGVTGDIHADTSGGSIKIDEAGGQVRADSSGGPIRVSFGPGNASGGSLSTSGGGITVTLDATVGLDIDASSSGGSVEFDMPLTVQGRVSKNAVKGKLGSGGELLKLRTSGGGIEIRSR
jgi:DUF4097 and DUF4098 domain-containing protein YvlB